MAAVETAAGGGATAEMWNRWAGQQLTSGRGEEAERGYRRALELDAANRQAEVNLGLLLFARGRLEEGLGFLERHKATLTDAERQTLLRLVTRFQAQTAGNVTASGTELSQTRIELGGETIRFCYRAQSEGDRGVIRQIFEHREYAIEHWVQGQKVLRYHRTHAAERPSLIVDAGANIGASALYFSKIFPGSVIFTIEPDRANWEILAANTAHDEHIFNFHGAISDGDGELALVDPGLSDWGFRTVAGEGEKLPGRGKVQGISPGSVLGHARTQETNPLLFKIDIEGAEAFLFRGECGWMRRFPLIVIELHDWLMPFSGSSRNFLRAAAQYEFDFVYRGENIFLFNRELLG